MKKFLLWADGRREWHEVDPHVMEVRVIRKPSRPFVFDKEAPLEFAYDAYDTFYRRTIRLGNTRWTEFHQDTCGCGICKGGDEWLPPELKEFCCRAGIIDINDMPDDEVKHMNDACEAILIRTADEH